jgi:hypothetical protein
VTWQDVAFTGVGTVMAAGKVAARGFDLLVARGAALGPRDTLAAAQLDGFVRHQVPRAAGEVLGTAVDRLVQAAAGAREAASRLEERWEQLIVVALGRVGVPSREEVALLRRRVAALDARLTELSGEVRRPATPRARPRRRPRSAPRRR